MNDLDKLKSLLFGAEKESLDSIRERVERPETRAVDVADILPEAIYQSHKNGDHLAVSLRAPVGECLEQAIHEDPKKYGDALYPVMGPAIRKSIMEALRAIAQQVNQAVEQSLTPQGLRWRFEAWRSGVPFGDYVLQKTLLYRVEQAYLISRENGLLMAHAHHDVASIKDSDAVSAMFTAIQDFVKESFSPDRSGRLESADMGEFTLWAVHGPHALLVCVIRGVPPGGLRAELSGILERVHFRYGEAMRTFAGDTAPVLGVEEELAECLRFEARQTSSGKKRRVSAPMMIVLLVLAAALGYAAYLGWQKRQTLNDFSTALQQTPGFYLDTVSADGSRMNVTGMRDPLAASAQSVAESIGLDPGDIDDATQPFQSLAPEIVARRAARQFGQPDGVTFSVNDSTLLVSGPSPVTWRQAVNQDLVFLSGIDSVSYQETDSERLQIVRNWLAAPDSVDIVTDADGLVMSGVAPAAWIRRAEETVATSNMPWLTDFSGIRTAERVQLENDVRALSNRNFFFTDGTVLAGDQRDALSEYVEQMAILRTRAEAQELAVQVTLTGFTDSVGDLPLNERLALGRTATVAGVLARSGFDAASVEQRQKTADDEDASVVDFNLRRVSVQLNLAPIAAE